MSRRTFTVCCTCGRGSEPRYTLTGRLIGKLDEGCLLDGVERRAFPAFADWIGRQVASLRQWRRQ